MTRFEQDPCALQPAAAVEAREEESTDSLFERWLARSNASRPRMKAAPATAPPPTLPPLGDALADAWFK
jgi:hypothetical protein